MLRPKQTKFKKYRKIRIKGIERRQTSLEFGSFGLRTLEGGQISSRQIEAVRRVITRKLKRTGKLWIRIFPNTPVTKKPAEVRMGKGKGSLDYWCSNVNSGRVLFEFQGVSKVIASEAAKLGSRKLPMQTKFISLEKK